MRRDSLRRRAYVNMRASGGSGNRSANSDERDALGSEIADQRLSFGAVGMHCDIDGFTVIEAKLIVCCGLADRA